MVDAINSTSSSSLAVPLAETKEWKGTEVARIGKEEDDIRERERMGEMKQSYALSLTRRTHKGSMGPQRAYFVA